jgi:formate hydrogenlyase transcriptional activator
MSFGPGRNRIVADELTAKEAALALLTMHLSLTDYHSIRQPNREEGEAWRRNMMRSLATNGDSAARRDQTSDLHLLVHSAPTLIHTGRPDGHLDFFNQTWLRYAGRSLEDLLGWKWTTFIHREDVEEIVERWRASLATGEPFVHEARVRRADGEYRWMLHHKLAVRDGSGQIVKWYGSSIDIEDRKRAEEHLRRRTRELKRSEFYLAEGQRLAHMGSWAFDPDGFDYWSPELFRIHGLDPAGKAPTVQEYLDSVPPEDRESMANLIEGILAKASSFDTTRRVVRPNGEVRKIRFVGLPVVENERLKQYVGTAIDVTDHELVTRELRRREAYLTEAQRLSHTGSLGCRLSTGEMFWSEETFRIYGYDPSTVPSVERVLERVHPEDRAFVQKHIDRAYSDGKDCELECRLLLPDESVKYVCIAARASKTESGIEFIGAVTDITERKTTEGKIRRLVDAGILGIFMANLDGEIVEANRAFLQMFQYDREDLVSGRLHWEDITPAELRERDQRAMREALATGFFQPYEKQFFRKDGSRLPVLLSGALFQNSTEGVSFVPDLSEQKRAEEKIREQETELRQILDLSPHLIAVFGPNRERLYANRQALEYLGMSLDEWRELPGNSYGPGWFIHPDERERAARAFSNSNRAGGSEHEFRVRGADGNYRWFLVRFNPLHDEAGQVKRWYLASTDIDERKKAEEKLQEENVALREEIDKALMFKEIVGTSKPLKAVLSRIAKVAPTDSTVLITGETGTGKELIARAVHKRSQRSGCPFVSVNCAALAPALVSSELFGHEKGAFTGATQRRLGRFEMADGGTIFLDEVGELLPDTQAALLRVLQEREFERLGGGQPVRVDVRVIAATNRDLSAAVANGTFRQDLLYRLNVFPIEMPPLRKRKDDILMLVEYFVRRYANRAGRNIRSIDQKTVDLLQSYDWPGNIRELQNVIERSIILSSDEVFSVDELWLSKRASSREPGAEPPPPFKGEAKPHNEQEIVEAALAGSRGRVSGPSGAAARLGMSPSTLEDRIKALKIDKRRFKYDRS